MEIKEIADIREQVGEIASEAFCDDVFFDYLSKSKQKKKKMLEDMFCETYDICKKHGKVFGAFDGENLIAFVLVLDYKSLKEDKQSFNKVFATSEYGDGYNVQLIIDKINSIQSEVPIKYILTACVTPKMQKRGVGSSLLKYVFDLYGDVIFVSDVDSPYSLSIFKKNNFIYEEIDKGYYFVYNLKEVKNGN